MPETDEPAPRFGEPGEDRKSDPTEHAGREPGVEEVVPKVAGLEEIETKCGEGEHDRAQQEEPTPEPADEGDGGEAQKKTAYPLGVAERVGIERR
jgi:hypothetical protein